MINIPLFTTTVRDGNAMVDKRFPKSPRDVSALFKPELVELTPYRDRQNEANVTMDDLEESAQAWEDNPPTLEGEDVTLILNADSE